MLSSREPYGNVHGMSEVTPIVAPIRRRDLVTTVAEELGTRIVSGLIAPGSALRPQDQLGEELQVSRPVIREAAKILESKGLLRSRPRTGMQVRDRADWQMLDPLLLSWQANAVTLDVGFIRNLLEVRAAVEPIAAGLAATRATVEDVALLAAALDAMMRSADVEPPGSPSSSGFIASDVEFHRGILSATHNELLLQIAGPVNEALKISDRFSSSVPGAGPASLPLHQDVYEAIRRRDPETAQRAMRKLVARAADDVAKLLESSEADNARKLADEIGRGDWPNSAPADPRSSSG